MRKAFTLAEVLITLTIIGVIASITIPNLINKWQNYSLATKFRKTYSNLNSAIAVTVKDLDLDDVGNWDRNRTFPTTLASNMKVKNNCGFKWASTADRGVECNLHMDKNRVPYASHKAIINTRKALNGTNNQNIPIGGSYKGQNYSFVLEDGALITVYPHEYGGTRWYPYYNPIDVIFGIDVNGEDVLPNQIGRDIFFATYVAKKTLVPYGTGREDNCIKGGIGNTCAKKVIVDKNLDY